MLKNTWDSLLGKEEQEVGGRKRPEHRRDTRVVSTTFRIADQTDQASKPALKVVVHLPSKGCRGIGKFGGWGKSMAPDWRLWFCVLWAETVMSYPILTSTSPEGQRSPTTMKSKQHQSSSCPDPLLLQSVSEHSALLHKDNWLCLKPFSAQRNQKGWSLRVWGWSSRYGRSHVGDWEESPADWKVGSNRLKSGV